MPAPPGEVVPGPTARPCLLKGPLGPPVPVAQLAAPDILEHEPLPVLLTSSHLTQHEDRLSRQRDDVWLSRCLLFSRTAAGIFPSSSGDRPDAGIEVELLPARRTNFV